MFSFLFFFVFVQATAEPLGLTEDMLSGYVFSVFCRCGYRGMATSTGHNPNMAVLRSAQTMHSAIAAMQHKYGLNITGSLDKDTIE